MARLKAAYLFSNEKLDAMDTNLGPLTDSHECPVTGNLNVSTVAGEVQAFTRTSNGIIAAFEWSAYGPQSPEN